MKYLLLICRDRTIDVRPEHRMGEQVDRWVHEMHGRGVLGDGHELDSISTARAVRVRDGELTITDGPFAESKEQLAGYDIIECRDLDEALEVASKHPVAPFGAIEVRPFLEG
jgi:hypothetical protein